MIQLLKGQDYSANAKTVVKNENELPGNSESRHTSANAIKSIIM